MVEGEAKFQLEVNEDKVVIFFLPTKAHGLSVKHLCALGSLLELKLEIHISLNPFHASYSHPG